MLPIVLPFRSYSRACSPAAPQGRVIKVDHSGVTVDVMKMFDCTATGSAAP